MNINKNKEILTRTLLLMKYDTKMTLTENQEIIVIKPLLSEQPDSKMPFQIEKFGYKQGDPSTVRPALKKQEEAIKSWNEIFDWLSTLDTHDWLMFVEISSGVLAMFSGPFAPIFIGIEVLAASADAYLYFKEGDPYMGGMVLALNLIPGGQFVRIMKGVKWLPKKGPKYVKLLLEKAKKGGKLTKTESDELAQIVKEFTEQSGPIKKAMSTIMKKEIVQSLVKKSPKFLVNLILRLSKSNFLKLAGTVAKIAGTAYTFDKLYLFTFRDTFLKDEKKLDSRTKNELRMLVNHLLGNEEAVNEFLLKKAQEGLMNMVESGEDPLKITPTESADEFFERELAEYKKNPINPEELKQETSDSEIIINYELPELQKVLKKEINPNTKKPYILGLGMKGESVKQIQSMLYKLNYGYLLDNYGELENGVDGKYGTNTKNAVSSFQEKNGLKVDGVVGFDTLNKLYELSKNE